MLRGRLLARRRGRGCTYCLLFTWRQPVVLRLPADGACGWEQLRCQVLLTGGRKHGSRIKVAGAPPAAVEAPSSDAGPAPWLSDLDDFLRRLLERLLRSPFFLPVPDAANVTQLRRWVVMCKRPIATAKAPHCHAKALGRIAWACTPAAAGGCAWGAGVDGAACCCTRTGAAV